MRTRAQCALLAALAVLWLGCERRAFFQEAPAQLGGVVVQCLGITDYGGRLEPCRPDSDSPARGCACQRTFADTGVPSATPDGNTSNAITSSDASCTTTLLHVCVPRVLPTQQLFMEGGEFPNGQLDVERVLIENRFNVIDNGSAGISPVTGQDFPGTRDQFNDLLFQSCFVAHFASITERVFNLFLGEPQFAPMIQILQGFHGASSTTIDSLNLSVSWAGEGVVDRQNEFGSKLVSPGRTICNETAQFPFSLGLLLQCAPGQNCTPGISNPQPSGTPLLVSCPDDDCALAPLSYQAVTDPVATTIGISAEVNGDSDSAFVDVAGGFEVARDGCQRDANDQVVCDATVRSVVLVLEGFEILGEEIAFTRIRSTAPLAATIGPTILGPETLTVSEFEGVVEARDPDGKYDFVEVASGSLLILWEPGADTFLAGVNLIAEPEDLTIRISGTFAGSFENISPVARVLATDSSGVADGPFECTSPEGTRIDLDSSLSIDADGDSLRTAWFEGSAPTDSDPILSTAESFLSAPLTLGEHGFSLRVFDRRGQVGEDTVSFQIQDTTPAEISFSPESACLWPSNHKFARFVLGEDILVSAVDDCAGDVGESIKIVSVTSNEPADGSGDGNTQPDIVFDESSVCLRAERSGSGTGREYTITVEADDGNGNLSTADFVASVPHDMSAITGCVTPRAASSECP